MLIGVGLINLLVAGSNPAPDFQGSSIGRITNMVEIGPSRIRKMPSCAETANVEFRSSLKRSKAYCQ